MFGIGLMILLAQPAFAEELGQANITPDMTMQEIRSNPVMQQSGLFLYGSFGEGTQWTRSRLENQTLQEYAWGQTVPETTAALNLAVQNVKDGVQVTWQVYSPEETEVDPSLGCVQLFYFPGSDPDGKYAIVMGGNALTINGTFGEGLPTAWELHEKGYTVFVLRYRAWTDLGDNAPLQDLGNAVNFITAHAEQLRVQPEDYAIVAYSSGAQVAGIFANQKRGYGAFGAQKPGALILGYPIVDFSIIKPVYHIVYDPTACGWRYYWTDLNQAVDDDYPPVYFWRGDNDTILGPDTSFYEAFEQALQKHGVAYQRTAFADAPHAVSIGRGTAADGWLDEAAAFWEEQVGRKGDVELKHRICTAAACICLLLMMALPAFAAEYGEPDITPQTTMGEIRSNPSILGAGVWTYSKEQNLPGTEDWCNDQTLEKYVSSHVAQDCADGLNLLIRNYNAGVQITYKLYSEQEIAEDSSRNNVEFYYYPASTPDAKYALVLSGNIFNRTAELKECISTAYQLHQKGYAVFVMRYRAYPDNDNNSPMEDIARAVKYIIGHAQQFGVQTESYALIGYSSGGHLAGMFASDALGYKNYGLPKPGAVILAYPIVQFAEITPIYRVGIDPFVCGRFYYEYSLADLITEDYPPVYFWYGRDDLTLNLLCWPLQGPALSKALTAHGVPYKEVVYDHAAHGIGLGRGTAADGWLDEAAAFWEEQTK